MIWTILIMAVPVGCVAVVVYILGWKTEYTRGEWYEAEIMPKRKVPDDILRAWVGFERTKENY